MSADLLVPAAALGPAAAAAVWLATLPSRPARSLLGGLLALGSVAAGWAVFWLAYQGHAPAWGGLSPTLLNASVAAFTATAVLLALPRAAGVGQGRAGPMVVGLGVGVASVVITASTESLVSVAILLPFPTLAAGMVLLSGEDRTHARGLAGLAMADVLGVVGLAWLLAESGTTLVARVGMVPGSVMVLASAAVKVGIVPWIGSWRVGATDGAGAPIALVLRAQGVILVLVVGAIGGGGVAAPSLVWGAGAAVLASGAAGLWARTPGEVTSAVIGVGGGFMFLALGLGGTVGMSALLLLFPPFLLATGAIVLLLGRRPKGSEAWPRWLGGAAAAAVAASLLALPPFGGFPGGWLALSLAWARGEVFPYLPAAAAVALGVGLGALSAAGLPRGLDPPRTSVAIGAAAFAALLYMGTQPVRLAEGWLIRIEAELGLPEILPTAGAPSLPPMPGWDLLWAGLPAVALVAAVLIAGRGLRDADRPFSGLLSVRRLRVPRWARPLVRRLRPAARWARGAVAASRAAGAGVVVFVILEAVALLTALWVVLRGVAMGFL